MSDLLNDIDRLRDAVVGLCEERDELDAEVLDLRRGVTDLPDSDDLDHAVQPFLASDVLYAGIENSGRLTLLRCRGGSPLTVGDLMAYVAAVDDARPKE